MRPMNLLLALCLVWAAPLVVAKDVIPTKPPPASADRATLGFYLTTTAIEIENFDLIYQVAFAGGAYEKALNDAATLKRKSADQYADMIAPARRLGLVEAVKKVRAAELAILDGGAPTTTEPKYVWQGRLSSLKADYASVAGALKVELETGQ